MHEYFLRWHNLRKCYVSKPNEEFLAQSSSTITNLTSSICHLDPNNQFRFLRRLILISKDKNSWITILDDNAVLRTIDCCALLCRYVAKWWPLKIKIWLHFQPKWNRSHIFYRTIDLSRKIFVETVFNSSCSRLDSTLCLKSSTVCFLAKTGCSSYRSFYHNLIISKRRLFHNESNLTLPTVNGRQPFTRAATKFATAN